jgi:hypothetical protein
MAIIGAHALLYTSEPNALRAMLRDAFGFNHHARSAGRGRGDAVEPRHATALEAVARRALAGSSRWLRA